MLSDDFASWRRLLVRDDQSAIGSLVDVVILALDLSDDGETEKKDETNCRF